MDTDDDSRRKQKGGADGGGLVRSETEEEDELKEESERSPLPHHEAGDVLGATEEAKVPEVGASKDIFPSRRKEKAEEENKETGDSQDKGARSPFDQCLHSDQDQGGSDMPGAFFHEPREDKALEEASDVAPTDQDEEEKVAVEDDVRTQEHASPPPFAGPSARTSRNEDGDSDTVFSTMLSPEDRRACEEIYHRRECAADFKRLWARYTDEGEFDVEAAHELIMRHVFPGIGSRQRSAAQWLRMIVGRGERARLDILTALHGMRSCTKGTDGTEMAAIIAMYVTGPVLDVEDAVRVTLKVPIRSIRSIGRGNLVTGETALHIAARRNDPRVLEVLIQDGRFSINNRDKSGRTPLNEAIRKKNVASALVLLARPDIQVTDEDERLAREHQLTEVCAAIQLHTPDSEQTDDACTCTANR